MKDSLYRDLTFGLDGPAIMKPEMIIPDDQREIVRGEPVEDSSHNLVIKKNNA